jgi:hypothetical protein
MKMAEIVKNDQVPTSLDQLTSYAGGAIVELPAFAEGQPLIAKMRRPSLLSLAQSGSIPNELLGVATQLFQQGGAAVQDSDTSISDIFKVMNILAKAALISPTYDDFATAGIELSDDQLMAIFSYTQVGVSALAPFRSIQ